MVVFEFKKYPVLTDGVIDVAVELELDAKHDKGVDWLPTYYFKINLRGKTEK